MHLMENDVETVGIVMGNNSASSVPAPMTLKEEPNEEYLYCDDCDFSTNTEDAYKEHVESTHVSDSQHSDPQEHTKEVPTSTKNGNNVGSRTKNNSGEKTECSICYRNVSHLKQHMKNCHPELENIKDTPLYKEILADKSLASSAASNAHGPNSNDFLTVLKQKIARDKEPREENTIDAAKSAKETLKDRVITINNTTIPLEECSLCHTKVLYLSQHIKEILESNMKIKLYQYKLDGQIKHAFGK